MPSALHQFFERTAERWPNRVAVEIPPAPARPRRQTTYAQLAQAARAIADVLRPLVRPDAVVVVFANRADERVYAAQLGVLMSGAAYTCIDPAFPDSQARAILDDAEPAAILVDAAGWKRMARLSPGRAPVLRINAASAAPAAPVAPAAPSSLAYLIYTSGTTGRPKGVMIEHRAIANLVQADVDEFRLTPDDRVAQGSSLAYDSSVEEIWLAFAAGATLVVMDDEASRLGPDLIPWLRDERVTVLCPPPTLLRSTGCADPRAALPELRLLYVGGEALPRDIADRWAPGRRLVNGYGPTEVTVTSVRADIHKDAPVAIGQPVRGLEAWVLNDSLEDVPDGEAGELCLGGAGLARGYRHQAALTAERFPTHPIHGRIYRTGDLVHRGPDGQLYCDGRIDTQVKLRGYRVELEAIEARLAKCAGVRDAACRVQHDGAEPLLVAFVVPVDPAAPPAFGDLRAALGATLPAYMVPGRFALIPALPTTIGHKLDRNALPAITHGERAAGRARVAPCTDVEARIAAAIGEAVGAIDISMDDDFFMDLGGDSLRAALAISRLRDDASTSALTVRDVYEARTAARMADRASATRDPRAAAATDPSALLPSVGVARAVLVTIAQSVWLLCVLVAVSATGYLAAFEGLPKVLDRVGLVPALVLGPAVFFAGLLIYTPVSIAAAVLIKRILIGRYQPMRTPVWSGFYLRHWMVVEAVRLVPWRLLEGTVFQLIALRGLGARIGRRVHLHRGVDLRQGGWDLLEIGDDVSIGQDASIRLIDLDAGHLVIGPMTIERGATIEVRASLGPNTHMEADSLLTALSALESGGRIPRGERWDGVPAARVGATPPPPECDGRHRALSPMAYSLVSAVARVAVWVALALPGALAALVIVEPYGVDSATSWLLGPGVDGRVFVAVAEIMLITTPLGVLVAAVVARLMGQVTPGIIPRWSAAYARVWIKTRLVTTVGEVLSGTLFWPVWLRAAGMHVGRGCEMSTIVDTVPELVTIADDTFLADGIYLAGPRLHRGAVTIAPVQIGGNVFLGNYVVIEPGQRLCDDMLLGICTVADDREMTGGSSWFGHPPFALPRREVVEAERRLTHTPSRLRYWNRVFWETLRFAMPVVPALALCVWFAAVGDARASMTSTRFFAIGLPAITFGVTAALCLLVLALKWLLLGRARPGQHALWSCWCSRWDFLYTAWDMWARRPLTALEGTLLLAWYLRAMGCHIGKRVVLGAGFAQVVDPDMLWFEDDTTVDAQLQAHTFEDRVLKIDRVTVRRGATVGSTAVLLYGAEVGAGARVLPNSVVMKKERLTAGGTYTGCPTRQE